jgi:SAM-dependent methyltransferase
MNEIDSDATSWERVAGELIASRRSSRIGEGSIRQWGLSLPGPATVLDLGCGSGVPVSQVLIEQGHSLYGIDSAPSLIATYRQQFPLATVACESVTTSTFFGRQFDGVVAIGLMFLLEPYTQRALIKKVGSSLLSEGRFLFTCPWQVCSWQDSLTGRRSQSLGTDAYVEALAVAGMTFVAGHADEGENWHIEAVRTQQPA